MIHGGDIYRNQVSYDFSININPYGMPDLVKEALIEGIKGIDKYPDPGWEEVRRSIAGQFEGELTEEMILCGNGASELLLAVCHALRPQKALLPVPCFQGYVYALNAVDCEIKSWYAKAETNFLFDQDFLNAVKREKPDIILLANPSNPTGQLMEEKVLEELLEIGEAQNSILLLDECFLDLTLEAEKREQVRRLRKYPNLLILKAFTKSFAIPGIRLGYLLCKNEVLRGEIKKHLPEWNVSVPAQTVGIAAAKEREFVRESAKKIAKEREFLSRELTALGGKVYPGTANYILFFIPQERLQKKLYGELLKHKILIRDCREYEGLGEGYFRIAVKQREENIKFLQVMQDIVSNESITMQKKGMGKTDE